MRVYAFLRTSQKFEFEFFTECESYFNKALCLVGEIGGNDYNYGFFAGGSIKQLKALVPLVVDAITKATSVCHIKQLSLLIYKF